MRPCMHGCFKAYVCRSDCLYARTTRKWSFRPTLDCTVRYFWKSPTLPSCYSCTRRVASCPDADRPGQTSNNCGASGLPPAHAYPQMCVHQTKLPARPWRRSSKGRAPRDASSHLRGTQSERERLPTASSHRASHGSNRGVPVCCSGAQARRQPQRHWYSRTEVSVLGGRPGACHAGATASRNHVGSRSERLLTASSNVEMPVEGVLECCSGAHARSEARRHCYVGLGGRLEAYHSGDTASPSHVGSRSERPPTSGSHWASQMRPSTITPVLTLSHQTPRPCLPLRHAWGVVCSCRMPSGRPMCATSTADVAGERSLWAIAGRSSLCVSSTLRRHAACPILQPL